MSVIFMMADKFGQRNWIEFCIKTWKSVTEKLGNNLSVMGFWAAYAFHCQGNVGLSVQGAQLLARG